MSRHSSELTDTQWSHIAPLMKPQASANGGPKPIPNRPGLKAFCSVVARAGFCLSNSPRPVRAGVGCNWELAKGVAGLAATTRCARPTRLGRNLRRR